MYLQNNSYVSYSTDAVRQALRSHTHTLSLSRSLFHMPDTQTHWHCQHKQYMNRIKKEIHKRAEFETEIEGQDARSRQKKNQEIMRKTEDHE